MSRIGRMPIEVPSGVDVNVNGAHVTVKGPKGTLERDVPADMAIAIADGVLTVERPSDSREHRSLHGLTRALLANMVTGVTTGFTKTLEINGVGYRAAAKGSAVEFALGYSHSIVFDAPDGISLAVEGTNKVIVSGLDNQLVGQVAANIRELRPPEPYKGKGIKYEDERIRRKAGKAAK